MSTGYLSKNGNKGNHINICDADNEGNQVNIKSMVMLVTMVYPGIRRYHGMKKWTDWPRKELLKSLPARPF